MSKYEQLIPSYAEQVARGLKPKGRCPKCGRELTLRSDQTVAAHNLPDRQGRVSKEICTDKPVRSMNLVIDRVHLDLSTVETRLLGKAVHFMLNRSIELDSDRTLILHGILEKMLNPSNMRSLSRTEEWQVLAELQAKEETRK